MQRPAFDLSWPVALVLFVGLLFVVGPSGTDWIWAVPICLVLACFAAAIEDRLSEGVGAWRDSLSAKGQARLRLAVVFFPSLLVALTVLFVVVQ